MVGISKLIVSLDFGEEKPEVGELVKQGRNIYFKYYQDFLKKGIQISPFKLPLSEAILVSDTRVFDGLFGVFNDSLPDGWGRLLMDRLLLSRGISLSEVTPLDRLAYVGRNGMGALVYEPAIETVENQDIVQNLDQVASETQRILAGESSAVLDALVAIGGSSGGARPKIFVKYNPQNKHILFGGDTSPEGYEEWIIKFKSGSDLVDIANVEYAYAQMALASGLPMFPCHLFKGQSGKFYFGTKRFDRIETGRLHMHSASGLMHDNFRLSNLDYGHIMDAAFKLENSVEAYEKVLRMAAFNIYAHNRDDHSKNFSFLMNVSGEWRLSPVYDLTFSNSSHGFHSTTVAGEGKNPGKKQLMELAETFGVRNCSQIIDEVKESVNKWTTFAEEAGITSTTKNAISKTLQALIKL